MKKAKNPKKRKIVFISGTRADFGKIKSIIQLLNQDKRFSVHIFVTGMHLSKVHGMTVNEIVKSNFKNIYRYANGGHLGKMDQAFAKTVAGFGEYIEKLQPDLIVVHGDRVEALAGALVGSLRNILVAHIEGGEISGTVDEHIRHSISKLSHIHFVANESAKKRLMQMGERKQDIFIIGSPDIDVMASKDLPSIEEVKSYYQIPFDTYNIMTFHPVTTELPLLKRHMHILTDALIDSKKKYVVIFPNTDTGADIIMRIYREKIFNHDRFLLLPSIRFEYFLTLLKHSRCMVGNSSAAIRESPFYGVPSINIGTRQNRRANKSTITSIVNVEVNKMKIMKLIERFNKKFIRHPSNTHFGKGRSAEKFLAICYRKNFWKIKMQKQFSDIK